MERRAQMKSKTSAAPPIPSLRQSRRWPRLSGIGNGQLRSPMPFADAAGPRKSAEPSVLDVLPVILVVIAAVVAAAVLYSRFLKLAPMRWNSVSHDRNAN